MTTQTQDQVQGAWDDYAEAPQTEWESQEGFRRITHYNPDPKKNQVLVDGQSLGVFGGFGAKTSAGTWRFGPEVDVPHGGQTDKEIVAHSLRNVAILGWSPRHTLLMGKPDGNKFATRIVSDYVEIPHRYSAANKDSKESFKVGPERIYYIAFLDDPELQVHQLVVRGNASGESAAIEKAIIRAAQRISFVLKRETNRDITLGIYGVRCNISVAAPHLTGKGNAQSQISPLVVDVTSMDEAELRKSRLIPGPIYKKLAAISLEVKDLVDKTDWEGTPTIETLVQLVSGTQVALPAGEPHESEAPAVDFKKAAEEMKAKAQAPAPVDPEDNITLGAYLSSEDNTFAWYDYLKLHGMTVKLALAKLKNCFPSMSFETFGACDIPLSECRKAIES